MTRSKDGLFSYLYTGGEDDVTSEMFPNNLKGFYMFISNSSDYKLGTDRPPILLTPKRSIKVTISRHFYRQAEWPYSTCGVLEDNSLAVELHDRYIFDQVLATNASYTQKTCLSFCTQLMIVRRCGCKSNQIGFNLTEYNYCSITDELGCAKTVANSLSDINEECLPKCPLECFKMKFELSFLENPWDVSQSILYWFPFYFRYFMTHEILADNSIKLQILYNDLAYVEMVEEPKMSSKDLLAAIGGHLHLFLGMSFLSFIELLEIVCSIGFTTTKKDTKSEKLINFQDAEKLKMDAIPNAIRSPHICLSIVWFVLFICASGACVYLIFDTIQEYNKHDVVTSLEHVNDQSIAFRFCNCFPLTSDYAIELMRNPGVRE